MPDRSHLHGGPADTGDLAVAPGLAIVRMRPDICLGLVFGVGVWDRTAAPAAVDAIDHNHFVVSHPAVFVDGVDRTVYRPALAVVHTHLAVVTVAVSAGGSRSPAHFLRHMVLADRTSCPAHAQPDQAYGPRTVVLGRGRTALALHAPHTHSEPEPVAAADTHHILSSVPDTPHSYRKP